MSALDDRRELDATHAAQLDRLRAEHVAALNAGDADAWVACFTPDAVQMPPGWPANVGTEAISGWSGGLLAGFDCSFALATDEVRATGPSWVFERGAYTIALTPEAGGDTLHDTGKYITLYERRADGRWLIARDIWNSDGER